MDVLASCEISIHAPREGSDHKSRFCNFSSAKFQSTLPARGATYQTYILSFLEVFQSTLPARGATLTRLIFYPFWRYFNPRSPRGERRYNIIKEKAMSLFQSTLPARGATGLDGIFRHSCFDFNPRSPRGERLINNRKDV